jgi:hypothetical protein
MYTRRLWKRASLSIGGPLEDMEGTPLPGTSIDSKRGLWKWRVSLNGSSVRGTWREGSFTGDPEGYVKDGSGNEHLSR